MILHPYRFFLSLAALLFLLAPFGEVLGGAPSRSPTVTQPSPPSTRQPAAVRSQAQQQRVKKPAPVDKIQTGYCCVNGVVEKSTDANCKRKRGRFFQDQRSAQKICAAQSGYCCKEGEVTKSNRGSCDRSRGEFSLKQAEAAQQCADTKGFCCDKGEVSADSKGNCDRKKGKFSLQKPAADSLCAKQKGYCCVDGEVSRMTQGTCDQKKGLFALTQQLTNRACQAEKGFCCNDGKVISSSRGRCEQKKGNFFTNRTEATRECTTSKKMPKGKTKVATQKIVPKSAKMQKEFDDPLFKKQGLKEFDDPLFKKQGQKGFDDPLFRKNQLEQTPGVQKATLNSPQLQYSTKMPTMTTLEDRLGSQRNLQGMMNTQVKQGQVVLNVRIDGLKVGGNKLTYPGNNSLVNVLNDNILQLIDSEVRSSCLPDQLVQSIQLVSLRTGWESETINLSGNERNKTVKFSTYNFVDVDYLQNFVCGSVLGSSSSTSFNPEIAVLQVCKNPGGVMEEQLVAQAVGLTGIRCESSLTDLPFASREPVRYIHRCLPGFYVDLPGNTNKRDQFTSLNDSATCKQKL